MLRSESVRLEVRGVKGEKQQQLSSGWLLRGAPSLRVPLRGSPTSVTI